MLRQYGAWLVRLSINQDAANACFKQLYSTVGTEILEAPQKRPSSSRVTTSSQRTRQLSLSLMSSRSQSIRSLGIPKLRRGFRLSRRPDFSVAISLAFF